MSKELLKQLIKEEVESALNEASLDFLKDRASNLLDSFAKDPTKLALFTGAMAMLGLHKRDVQYIINIQDPALQKVEFRHLIDKVVRTNIAPKSILSYSYFGKRPQIREK